MSWLRRTLIDVLRHHSPAYISAGSMSVPSAVQIKSAMEVVMGRDGTDRGSRKLTQLRDNANYLRRRLTEMGCSVLGDYDSPVLVCTLQQENTLYIVSRSIDTWYLKTHTGSSYEQDGSIFQLD